MGGPFPLPLVMQLQLWRPSTSGLTSLCLSPFVKVCDSLGPPG